MLEGVNASSCRRGVWWEEFQRSTTTLTLGHYLYIPFAVAYYHLDNSIKSVTPSLDPLFPLPVTSTFHSHAPSHSPFPSFGSHRLDYPARSLILPSIRTLDLILYSHMVVLYHHQYHARKVHHSLVGEETETRWKS
jgi:hypothetical protein